MSYFTRRAFYTAATIAYLTPPVRKGIKRNGRSAFVLFNLFLASLFLILLILLLVG